MTSLRPTFNRWLVALVAIACSAGPALAATFEARRGINLDIWVTWPDESRWGDSSALLPFPEWRRFLDDGDLRGLRAAGFDFVRIPVDPAPFLSDTAADLHGQLVRSVQDSVRLVNRSGLKAVVDLHLFPAGSNRSVGMTEVMNDPAIFDRYVELVRTMARALSAEDPSQVAFELMNEPVIGCAGQEARDWSERLGRLFAAARASATRTTLVLSGGCWGAADGLVALDPRTMPDDNVMWTFHSYAPFLLTHQGATWTGDFIRYVTGLPYPPHAVPRADLDAAIGRVRDRIRAEAPLLRRAGMLSYLDEQIALVDTEAELSAAMRAPFDAVAGWAATYGVAAKDILLGEFGMIRQEYGGTDVVPGPERAAYYRDMIALAERRGFAWSLWSYGGAFGVVEAFDGQPAEPDVLEMVRGLPR